MKNNIYTLKLDSDINLQLEKFQKTLKENEEIVSTQVANNTLIIVTKNLSEQQEKKSKLLFD